LLFGCFGRDEPRHRRKKPWPQRGEAVSFSSLFPTAPTNKEKPQTNFLKIRQQKYAFFQKNRIFNN